MAITLNHQTKAEFIARFRSAYRDADKDRLAVLAGWLLNHIALGDITDAQAQNAFGLNPAQWTTLKTKMQTLVSNYSAVESAVGE